MAKHIVIGASSHAAIAAIIQAARPDLAIRANNHTALTLDDLEWGDSYIGFRKPPGDSMGNIRWVHSTGAGVDAWLYPEILSREVILTRTSESFGPRIAEWALARALTLTQQTRELSEAQRARLWSPREITMLRGSRVVIVGTGDIGSHCARLFSALGCDVAGVSRSGTRVDAFHETHSVESLPTLLPNAEWIILTIPLTAQSFHLFDRSLLSRCRGAVLINAGRGAVVDEAALPEALDAGWLRAAALDVFETEPLPTTSPLWSDPRVIVSPHISGLTTPEGAATGFLECLASFERGESTPWLVDRTRGY